MEKTIIGRDPEWATLADRNGRPQAQMIAVYGRRRVGKTFLVENFFARNANLMMTVVGEHNGKRQEHLHNFRRALERAFSVPVPTLLSWRDAFEGLAGCLGGVAKNAPQSVCVFIDELPWFDTHRSGLVDALAHAWETSLRKFGFLRLVVCGSAASWMIRNIIDHKGGLHNRVSERMNIRPFQLGQVQAYFDAREMALTKAEVLELYLTLGGIPYYLDLVRAGESPAQAIGRICFGDGPLVEEKRLLFRALFGQSGRHQEIVDGLSEHPGGLTRSEIVDRATLASGGRIDQYLTELEESGFVARLEHWDGKPKNTRVVLIDPFLLFEAKIARRARRGGFLAEQQSRENWFSFRNSQSYAAHMGYAFENCCLQHVRQIRHELGLAPIGVRLTTWRKQGNAQKGIKGGQIDLVLDRDDGRITLCEMKHQPSGVEFTHEDEKHLAHRMHTFKKDTKTEKHLENVLVCSHGARQNAALKRAISRVVHAEAFWKQR